METMSPTEVSDLARSSDITSEGALLLYSLARIFGYENLVEIGVGNGVSTHALLAGSEARGARLYSCDVADLGHMVSVPQLRARWHFTQCRSEDFSLPPSIDLAFIDGDHSYERVKGDLALVASRLTPGGIIVAHDVATPWKGEHHPGVKQAVNEFLDQGSWEYSELPFGPGFGVLRRTT